MAATCHRPTINLHMMMMMMTIVAGLRSAQLLARGTHQDGQRDGQAAGIAWGIKINATRRALGRAHLLSTKVFRRLRE